MYNEANKLLFIHIPKTGGTSISEYMLNLSGESMHGNISNDGEYLGEDPIYRKRVLNKIEGHFIGDFYTHLNVEGHLDYKLVSADTLRDSLKFAVVRDPIDRLVSIYTFYFEKMFGLSKAKSTILEAVNGVRSDITNIMMPQSYWIEEDMVLLRFDHLNGDFDKFINKFNLPRAELSCINVSKNSKARKDFIKEFTPDEIRQIMHFYREDIEIFNQI